MMKKSLLAVALLSIVLPFANSAGAADCICPKYPFYPYPGGNWFHYALYHPNCNCNTSTPTGYIAPLSPPLSCPSCIALATPSLPDLKYVRDLKGFDKAMTPAEADVSDDNGVKLFLDKVQPGTLPDQWELAKFTKFRRLQIRRKIGEKPDKYDSFTVALYKFHYHGQQGPGGVGLQVNDSFPSPVVYVPQRFRVPCDNNSTTVYETAPGLIKIFFANEWWMVRIDDSAENNTDFAFPIATAP